MLRSLDSGVSGLQQFQGQMDVIGNNIANTNTTGYKSARVQFSDAFSQTLRASSAATGTSSGTSSMQVGSGVATGAVNNQFSQGSTARTGLPTDLAVSGQGFFLLRDPANDSEFVTRAGDFRVDANGYFVTNSGMYVQGYSDSGLATLGDIRIDATGAPATAAPGASVASFSFDQQGKLNVRLSDGTEYVRGQILLQNFLAPQALAKEGDNLYSGLVAAGPLVAPSAPGSAGLGNLVAGALEQSNVDLAFEFSTMITTQRAFQACSRVITTSDEMLQELVNLKR